MGRWAPKRSQKAVRLAAPGCQHPCGKHPHPKSESLEPFTTYTRCCGGSHTKYSVPKMSDSETIILPRLTLGGARESVLISLSAMKKTSLTLRFGWHGCWLAHATASSASTLVTAFSAASLLCVALLRPRLLLATTSFGLWVEGRRPLIVPFSALSNASSCTYKQQQCVRVREANERAKDQTPGNRTCEARKSGGGCRYIG